MNMVPYMVPRFGANSYDGLGEKPRPKSISDFEAALSRAESGGGDVVQVGGVGRWMRKMAGSLPGNYIVYTTHWRRKIIDSSLCFGRGICYNYQEGESVKII